MNLQFFTYDILYHGGMDYYSWYEKISAPFDTPTGRKAISVADRALVALFACAYIGLLVWLVLSNDPHLLKAISVPAATFAIATALRHVINRPRPYESGRMNPLVHKDTEGKSLPSKHMASAVIIASTFCWVGSPLGAVLLVCCACIAFTRIVGGMHYPTDIIAAIALSGLCAFVGYIIIP